MKYCLSEFDHIMYVAKNVHDIKKIILDVKCNKAIDCFQNKQY